MQAALAAGEAPVLAQMEIGMLGIFADADQLVDLQKFVDAEGYDIGDFMPGLLDASYYNDALVALPHSRSVPVLYYNKDRFKEAGLDENKPPVTWDELKEDSSHDHGRPLVCWPTNQCAPERRCATLYLTRSGRGSQRPIKSAMIYIAGLPGRWTYQLRTATSDTLTLSSSGGRTSSCETFGGNR